MHINLCNKKTSAKYVPSDTFYALESMKRFLSLHTHFFFFFLIHAVNTGSMLHEQPSHHKKK